ncbi:MAG: ERF family protein [Gemmatimonadaceae bacterium]|nr:ERF family protein [Gemmatimonadaceae bacterium]
MTHSPMIDELVTALVDARKAFGVFGKAHTAKVASQKGSYEYKYGDLADLFAATTPALSQHGLTISQWPVMDDGRFQLVTLLLHKSGQWMRGEYPLAMYERPQDQGSALTYAKRYCAASVLGIAAEVDDDGAAAQQGTPKPAMPPQPAAGYEGWVLDLEAAAEGGVEALRDAFKNSKAEYRDYRTRHDVARHEALKAKAAKVGA